MMQGMDPCADVCPTFSAFAKARQLIPRQIGSKARIDHVRNEFCPGYEQERPGDDQEPW